ncbi:MAG: endonuclease III [Deltaproteobacteria bacterium]|nr:endonuclease III [Deltaproteobacteria bacterium]
MEDPDGREKRARRIFEILDPVYTMKKTALEYRSPFQLLIATILSAQCTDRQVNKVTTSLFKKYRTPDDYVRARISELEKDIKSTGFYRNKARSIKGCCEELIRLYGGKVPGNMEGLLRLPGVGRKTANCVLGAAFGVPGIVVDTHVKRLCLRLGLTENNHPDKIEKDVEKLLPRDKWRRFSDILIYHGRAVCKARKPAHDRCQVFHLCPSNSI